MSLCTSAICDDTDAPSPIGIRQKSAVHLGGVGISRVILSMVLNGTNAGVDLCFEEVAGFVVEALSISSSEHCSAGT